MRCNAGMKLKLEQVHASAAPTLPASRRPQLDNTALRYLGGLMVRSNRLTFGSAATCAPSFVTASMRSSVDANQSYIPPTVASV